MPHDALIDLEIVTEQVDITLPDRPSGEVEVLGHPPADIIILRQQVDVVLPG